MSDIMPPLYEEIKELFDSRTDYSYLNHAEIIVPYLEENGYDMNMPGNLEALVESVYELGYEDGQAS